MIVTVGWLVIYKITASSPLGFSTFPLFSSKAAVISLLTSPSFPPSLRLPSPHYFPQTPPHTPHLHLQRPRLHTTFDVSSAEVVFPLLSFFSSFFLSLLLIIYLLLVDDILLPLLLFHSFDKSFRLYIALHLSYPIDWFLICIVPGCALYYNL
ncbi:hypothetical protein P167DRAFT_249590 [Morchella conica CCBAS932]|uniref:Uncharacterized protein n=1 Tax=Morchella conica CCBAS932 TaxID=1392247 RepID=A0A3N4KJ53_9PEZI|nr:hypothetical protein P167DRAFT_249590 [Morchella conica CCBAS932]